MLHSMGLQIVTTDPLNELMVSSLVVQCVGVSATTPKFQGLISSQERRSSKWIVMALYQIRSDKSLSHVGLFATP